MANDQQLRIVHRGVEAWNEWRKRNLEVAVDLSGVDLSGVNLSGAMLGEGLVGAEFTRGTRVGSGGWRVSVGEVTLKGANLKGANLHRADLMGTDLNGADLRAADISRAHLRGSSFCSANLADANLEGADLSYAGLVGADLSRANLTLANMFNAILCFADLTGCCLGGAFVFGGDANLADFTSAEMCATTLANIDLSRAKGLETVRHTGPSPIPIDTLYKSKGKIPTNFLLGCGIPQDLLQYLSVLLESETLIQSYSCFISYSSKDQDFATRLHGRMRDAGLSVWFAPEDIRGGKKVHEQIEMAIHDYDKLLIVLSKASLRSEWVMTELRKAFKAERHQGIRKLFPVRLVDFSTLRDWECFDADSGKDLAAELREYFIPDFADWKDVNSFETTFQRLLGDLRSRELPVVPER